MSAGDVLDVDQDVDQLDAGALSCADCGSAFTHAGRGRKPKRCPECRGTPRARSAPADDDAPKRAEAPKRPRGVETLKANIAQQLTMLGVAVAFFDPFDSHVIVSKAAMGAEALANLAATNPKIRRLLESSVEAAGYGPVALWAAQMFLPIAAHHGWIRGVPDPAKATPNGRVNGSL